MKYCKKCIMPDTMPGLTFDSEGVCHVCRYAEKNKEIDWEAREKEIKEIAEWAKKNRSPFTTTNNNGYDCVVGVSGGKDSTRIALYCKDVLKLHCLLVCICNSEMNEEGKQNLDNLYRMGFDLLRFNANPRVERAMSKHCFYKYGNLNKSSEYFIFAGLMRAALAYKVPLAVWGENPAIYQGGKTELGNDGNAINLIYHNTTAGGNAMDLLHEDVTPDDVFPFQYPSREEIKEAGIKYVYMGYYIKDWSSYRNAQFAIARGLKVRPGDPHDYGRIYPHQGIDSNVNVVNNMLKYFKLGFGTATDELCYDIREGRRTRDEAIKLAKEFDGKCSYKYIKIFCDFIGITVDEFWRVAESFRNKDIWEKVNGEWKLKTPLE